MARGGGTEPPTAGPEPAVLPMTTPPTAGPSPYLLGRDVVRARSAFGLSQSSSCRTQPVQRALAAQDLQRLEERRAHVAPRDRDPDGELGLGQAQAVLLGQLGGERVEHRRLPAGGGAVGGDGAIEQLKSQRTSH